MIKYVPNLMTLSRILLTPLMIYFMISESNQNYSLAFMFFVIASITDYFDGKIARKYDIESRFGIFIDPLADKLLIVSAFVSFRFIPEIYDSQIVTLWMIGLISFRDVFVTALRILMESKGETMVTSKVAKFKTFFQIVTIIALFIYLHSSFSTDDPITDVMKVLMVVTTLITFYTGMHYFMYNYRAILRLFVR